MKNRVWLDINDFRDLKELEKFIVNGQITLTREEKVESNLNQSKITASQDRADSMRVRNELFVEKKYDSDSLEQHNYAILCRNKYPVTLPAGTEHWNVWIDDYEISQKEAWVIINTFLLEKCWNKKNTIIFEKSIHRRSLPYIRHWHIYVEKP